MRWIKCYDCSRTYSVDFWAAFFTNFGDENASLQKDFMFKCWEEECVYMPALPALFPVREKLFLDHILKTQLETAQAAAERCRTLTVIGSALRDSDKDFVDLVRLAGTRGDTLIVVNPNKEAASRTEAVCGKTCERYDSLRALVHKDRRRWWWPFRWPA
jgi:hypothetical protein